VTANLKVWIGKSTAFAAALVLGAGCTPILVQAQASPALALGARERLVQQFIDAFNAQDSAAMGRLVTEDVRWLSIEGENVAVETDSRQALLTGMDAYFHSCPSCRSSLSGMAATTDRVSAVETAQWRSANGLKQQRSISVYEFAGPLIRRVYYFPAEREEPPTNHDSVAPNSR